MTTWTEYRALKGLALASTDEDFGPGSARPHLTIDLAQTELEVSDWLSALPCPVIGIGSGALADSCDVVLPNERGLATLQRNIERAPIAAMTLVQLLRFSSALSVADALTAESFAYSTVQMGPEFHAWRQGRPVTSLLPAERNLDVSRVDGALNVTFKRPDTRNAIGVEMRDALCEALDMALLDNSITRINLAGDGPVFSSGGAVEEFGDVTDPATAHWIRTLRLPANRLAKLGHRLHVHINGAAIGAGVEMAGFAAEVTASPRTWFQLPELKYGLIPGAGGTASLPRRIGRQRTAQLALSGQKIRAKTALDWGLIDRIID